MDIFNTTIVAAAIFALVLIFCVFRFTTLSATLSALGAKLTLRGQKSRSSKIAPASNGGGIRKNWLFGKVNVETKGSARIDKNVAAGDVTMKAEEQMSLDKSRGGHKPHN